MKSNQPNHLIAYFFLKMTYLISMGTNTDNRSSWQIDLKWIFGILASFCLSVTLLLFAITNLTNEKTAVPLMALVVASQFSRDGLDASADIDKTKQLFLSSNENVYYPFTNNKEVKITREQLLTLSPREIRLLIFRQVVEPYYKEGLNNLANRLGKTPQEVEKIKRDGSLLGLVNYQTHQNFNNYFLISLLPLGLFLAGLLLFSYRYGRLISLGVVLILVTSLPAILLLITTHAKGGNGPVPFLTPEIYQALAQPIARPYYFLFLTGIGLLIGAAVLRLVTKLTKK